ncbi:MAG: LysR family transcriptional regulator [Candidatus Competibacterales bacterium]|nr:LysR family transcriptional regulator [Candidatus Competibacterales bacterium]
MNITMRQLQVFQAVARHLSFTRAGAALHLTQPAVSMQIRQLEETLGLPLFEQIGKRVQLTVAGRELLEYSRRITAQLTEIGELFAALRGAEYGTLRLAVPGTANHFATRLLAAFCCVHPGVSFDLDVANRRGLLARLADNETDLVIMGRPPPGRDLISRRFMDNPLVVIAAPDHPCAGRDRVPLVELLDQPFLVREPGSGTRSAMERFFAEQQMTPAIRMTLASNEAIKQAVAAGLGLGIVSLHTLELELSARRLVVLKAEGFPIMRHWYLVHRRGKRLAPVTEAFGAFVLAEAHNLWPLAAAPA